MPDDQICGELEAADLPTRIAAIERAALEPNRYAESVVALISRFPSQGYFVLERVDRFGEAIVPHLFALAESTTEKDIRLMAVLGLAHFQQNVDSAALFEAIRARSEYQHLACRALAWLGRTEFVADLQEALLTTSPVAEWDRMVSLIEAIERLGGKVSGIERERLISLGSPLTKKCSTQRGLTSQPQRNALDHT